MEVYPQIYADLRRLGRNCFWFEFCILKICAHLRKSADKTSSVNFQLTFAQIVQEPQLLWNLEDFPFACFSMDERAVT